MDTMNQHKYREYYRKQELCNNSFVDKKFKSQKGKGEINVYRKTRLDKFKEKY